jgi:hypothetical protein
MYRRHAAGARVGEGHVCLVHDQDIAWKVWQCVEGRSQTAAPAQDLASEALRPPEGAMEAQHGAILTIAGQWRSAWRPGQRFSPLDAPDLAEKSREVRDRARELDAAPAAETPTHARLNASPARQAQREHLATSQPMAAVETGAVEGDRSQLRPMRAAHRQYVHLELGPARAPAALGAPRFLASGPDSRGSRPSLVKGLDRGWTDEQGVQFESRHARILCVFISPIFNHRL